MLNSCQVHPFGFSVDRGFPAPRSDENYTKAGWREREQRVQPARGTERVITRNGLKRCARARERERGISRQRNQADAPWNWITISKVKLDDPTIVPSRPLLPHCQLSPFFFLVVLLTFILSFSLFLLRRIPSRGRTSLEYHDNQRYSYAFVPHGAELIAAFLTSIHCRVPADDVGMNG